MNGRPTVKALRQGKRVEIEGCFFEKRAGQIQPGDFYVAERNGPAQLLTARIIRSPRGPGFDYIVPEENAYCFDVSESVRVSEVDNATG